MTSQISLYEVSFTVASMAYVFWLFPVCMLYFWLNISRFVCIFSYLLLIVQCISSWLDGNLGMHACMCTKTIFLQRWNFKFSYKMKNPLLLNNNIHIYIYIFDNVGNLSKIYCAKLERAKICLVSWDINMLCIFHICLQRWNVKSSYKMKRKEKTLYFFIYKKKPILLNNNNIFCTLCEGEIVDIHVWMEVPHEEKVKMLRPKEKRTILTYINRQLYLYMYLLYVMLEYLLCETGEND